MLAAQWVFWDLGNVLIKVNFDLFLERMARLMDVEISELVGFITDEHKPSLWHQLESWDLSEREIHQRFLYRFGVVVPLREFVEAFNFICEGWDRYRIMPILNKLRAQGVNLALISNINRIHADHSEATYPLLFSYFKSELRFYSYRMGLRKSGNPEAFLYVMEQCGAEPESSVLIDDQAENIVGFEKTGGRGILFRGFYALEYGLSKLGFL